MTAKRNAGRKQKQGPAGLMWAAVYRGERQVRAEQVPVPQPGRGEALVRVDTCGVCATDLKKVEYGLVPPPRIFGHEMAGVIERVGPEVKSWKPGQRVAVLHHIPCGDCAFCRRREYSRCETYKRTGTTAGFEPSGGGFSQFIRVMPWVVERGMFRVPARIALEEACFLEPVNTCLKAVDRLALRKDDVVLVFGQGPIGLIFNQLLRVRGARVLGLDLLVRRRALGRQLGAHLVADPRERAFDEELWKLTRGGGADAAVIAVPSETAFQQAMKAVRPDGKVLLFAHTRRGDMVSVDAGAVCVDEKTILGSYSAAFESLPETARLIFARKVKVAPLISHRYPLARIQEGFELAMHPIDQSLKIVIKPQEKLP